jgi:phosphate transport system ATP-binding protein
MDSNVIIKLNKVNFYYGQSRALTDISMKFVKNKVPRSSDLRDAANQLC